MSFHKHSCQSIQDMVMPHSDSSSGIKALVPQLLGMVLADSSQLQHPPGIALAWRETLTQGQEPLPNPEQPTSNDWLTQAYKGSALLPQVGTVLKRQAIFRTEHPLGMAQAPSETTSQLGISLCAILLLSHSFHRLIPRALPRKSPNCWSSSQSLLS